MMNIRDRRGEGTYVVMEVGYSTHNEEWDYLSVAFKGSIAFRTERTVMESPTSQGNFANIQEMFKLSYPSAPSLSAQTILTRRPVLVTPLQPSSIPERDTQRQAK